MKKALLICTVTLYILTLNIQAQVTIGSGIPPTRAALLDLKVKQAAGTVPSVDDDTNITAGKSDGGLLLPRVKLVNTKTLEPFIPVDDPEFVNNTNSLREKHAGLIVYNLAEDDSKDLCPGLNQWDGEQWNCLQNKMGNATGHIVDCADFEVFGYYKSPDVYPNTPSNSDAVPLDASNYLSIKLEITKPGAYTITAIPGYAGDGSKTNGYFFIASGVFMEKGIYVITIPGSGTPFWLTPTGNPGDALTVTMNNKPLTKQDGTLCEKKIKVEDSSRKPLFRMDCGSIKTHGTYVLDRELNPLANYIEIVLNIDAADWNSVAGSTYVIGTNTIDGIYFKGQGILTSLSQTVKLQGYGIPNSVDKKEFIITTNSKKTTATCKATVIVAIPKKKILHIGSVDTSPGYLAQPTNGGSGANKVLTSLYNFGTEDYSTVKCEGYESTVIIGSPNQSMIDAINSKPDIVIIGYYFHWNAGLSAQFIQAVKNYVNNKGVLLMLDQHDYDYLFIRALYDDVATVITTPLTTIYNPRLPNTPGSANDPIINGPFGDLRGLFWGGDCGDVRSVLGLTAANLIVYSKASNGNLIFFRDPNINFIYNGEGGILANPSRGNTGPNATGASSTTYPFAIEVTTYKPITRTGWTTTGGGTGNVENSRLFANMMAWAINQAEFNGINTP
ncbi:MAG: hypothetical protein LBV71_05305 [Prevotella sp.]|jgi:hypothetical protein|nr:hypothetical protein [Prevotella sp.]